MILHNGLISHIVKNKGIMPHHPHRHHKQRWARPKSEFLVGIIVKRRDEVGRGRGYDLIYFLHENRELESVVYYESIK